VINKDDDKVLCFREREEDQDHRNRREPTTPLTYDDAQELMDTMWRAGLRPSDLRGVENGQLAAIKDEVIKAKDGHIEDLRKLI
jgi:hypothetical protein